MVLIKEKESGQIDGMPENLLREFNSTLIFDRRLFVTEVSVSFVYADSLFNAGVLTRLESERIKNGLQTILKRAEHDSNYFDNSTSEDVFTFIEEKLVQLIGEPARKIHIGRSRAEQISTTLRIWLRSEIEEISGLAKKFQKSIIRTGEKQFEAVLPTVRIIEKRPPTLWANWCLAYFEMISRDRERLDEVWRRVNILPSGTDENAEIVLEIDFEEAARALKFEGIAANNFEAASDRDFVVEFVGACAILITHLSRLAADLILYSSSELEAIKFSDEKVANSDSELKNVCTSALKNLDGKSGRVFGHQTALFSNLKRLSLNAVEDSREVIEAVFDTVDTIKLSLENAKIILDLVVVDEIKTDDATKINSLNKNIFFEKIYEALENAKKNLIFEEN